jgi:hypothetical protein
VETPSCEVPVILVGKLEFSGQIFEKYYLVY